MPSSSDCWGIEIGAHAIKALRLQKAGQKFSVTEFDVIPYKKVLTTPDIDVDEQIRLGMDQLLARHTIGNATIVVSVPGHMAFARFAKLPPVEPKKVPDIVKFEAVQQIPFPIEQVEWDYQTFQHADSPDVEVGIFAITKERVANWLNNFHAVGLHVHAMTLSPLAVYNAIAYDEQWADAAPGTILMDIGTSATDLIIIEGGRLWLRTIPIGGHHFTEALVRGFKLSYSKAEKIKKEAATSKYARQIFQAMRPVFVDLVGEVQKSLGYYQSLNRDADLKQLIGMGSTFRLPGLQKFLKQQLQLEVIRHDEFKSIEIDGRDAASFAENALSMAPAYGLALQGLEQDRVTCNVLPSVLIRQQVWKSKVPYNIAAAVLFSAAAVIGYSNLWIDRQTYAANSSARQQAQAIISTAQAKQTEWKAIEGGSDPRSKIENLRRILDYRNVWPSILTDIDAALASTKPQEEVVSADPEAIKTIPRQLRKQVTIDLINYGYESKKQDTLQIFGERSAIQGGMYEGFMTNEEMEARRSAQATATPTTTGEAQPVQDPPSFTITISGTTTRESAPKFLNDTLVKYFNDKEAEMDEADKSHAADPAKNPIGRDRPYRITNVKIDKITPLLTLENRPAAEIPGNPRIPGAAEEAPAPLPGVRGLPGAVRPLPGVRGLPGAVPGPGIEGEFPGEGGRANSGTTTDVASLLPGDPLAKEDHTSDWSFVMTFRIELIRPEEARKAEQDEHNTTTPAQPVASVEGR
ncbi:MAG: type IV pilus assembly protein PilM [Planctomycetes bacterium]|nr:type IV pilus assembly protein PilM [Planctomycetota bacterium]